MFERFTDRARRVVVLAQEEARLLQHDYIGTEHILLGLVTEGSGVAAQALESLGVSLEGVRREVADMVGVGEHEPTGHIPFTPRAKKVLELSLREALQLGHNYIGTEHILLGLIREGEGVAAQVLPKLGADLSRVRTTVLELLSRTGGEAAAAGPRRPPLGPWAPPAGTGAPVLDRVVPVARTVELDDGARLIVLSVDIWEGWFDLRYVLVVPAPAGAAPPAWSAGDEHGTVYQPVASGASGTPGVIAGHQSFQPVPLAKARRLLLEADRGDGNPVRLEVDLTPPGGAAQVKPA